MKERKKERRRNRGRNRGGKRKKTQGRVVPEVQKELEPLRYLVQIEKVEEEAERMAVEVTFQPGVVLALVLKQANSEELYLNRDREEGKNRGERGEREEKQNTLKTP
jgi:hypothetical protein